MTPLFVPPNNTCIFYALYFTDTTKWVTNFVTRFVFNTKNLSFINHLSIIKLINQTILMFVKNLIY